MQIKDGASGKVAGVDSEGRLKTYSITLSEFALASRNGDAYAWSASKNIDATDCILWLRNDSRTHILLVQTIILSSDAAGSYFVYSSTGTTADGDVVTGINLNRVSQKVAEATCRCDATGTTPANYIHYGHIPADTDIKIPLEGALILDYLDELGIDITDEPALAQATILGYFIEK